MGVRDGFLSKVARLDRRWIFLAILLSVALPFVVPIEFEAMPSEETLRFDRALGRALDTGRPLVIGVDFGPQTMAELEPVLLAIMHRVFAAGGEAVFLTFMPEAASPLRAYLARMEEEHDLVYGRDYVFLGYASSYAYTIYGMGASIETYFHEDDRGTPIRDLELMKDLGNLTEAAAVLNVASNSMPKFWIQYGVAPLDLDFLVACTAVQATDYFPYLQTGQLDGLLAGGRAGAEYEGLLVDAGVLPEPGDATRGLGSQSLAIFAILAFIALGNAGYFLGRRRDAGGGRP